MRLVDADALYEKTAKWEAQALHMVEVTMHDEDKTEWRKWSTVLTERSAFKYDIADAPTIEPKKGKWEEKHHAYADEEKVIEEWQSCRCSVCGRYDTRPYMYYFDEPHFCSWCGADMRGEEP